MKEAVGTCPISSQQALRRSARERWWFQKIGRPFGGPKIEQVMREKAYQTGTQCRSGWLARLAKNNLSMARKSDPAKPKSQETRIRGTTSPYQASRIHTFCIILRLCSGKLSSTLVIEIRTIRDDQKQAYQRNAWPVGLFEELMGDPHKFRCSSNSV